MSPTWTQSPLVSEVGSCMRTQRSGFYLSHLRPCCVHSRVGPGRGPAGSEASTFPEDAAGVFICLPVTLCEALGPSDGTVGRQPVGVAQGGPITPARAPQFSIVFNVVLALCRVCVSTRVAVACPVLGSPGGSCAASGEEQCASSSPEGPPEGTGSQHWGLWDGKCAWLRLQDLGDDPPGPCRLAAPLTCVAVCMSVTAV